MQQSFIPFADPRAAYLQRKEEILAEVARVLDSGIYIMGPEVDLLQQEFAAWLSPATAGGQAPLACLGVGNGTDAIELILRGLFARRPDLAPAALCQRGKAGAAVITVSHTAVATVSAIERAGAVPVLADIEPHSLTLCPDSLAKAIQAARDAGLEPVAVIPVHIYGHPCRMADILALAEKEGLFVLEDCAQAVGATLDGRHVGCMGHAAAISCYPTKNLGALGDAGLVCTKDATLMEEMRALAQYGWKERYISALPGINTRLDPVQAAILRVNLRHLDADLALRRELAHKYSHALAGHDLVRLPATAAGCEHAWHLYVLRVPTPGGGTARRDALLAHLRGLGVGASLHYPQAVHQQPAYAGRCLTVPGGLPCTDALYEEILTLPLFPHMQAEQAARVVEGVLSWEGQA